MGEQTSLIIVCNDKMMEYANFLVQLIGLKDDGEEVVGTEYVDINSAYTAVTPSTFDEIVTGWYSNPELTEEFVDGTVLSTSTNLYAKIHTFAPEGVLESFENGDGSSSSKYAWVYDYASNSFTSSNKGVSNSSSSNP